MVSQKKRCVNRNFHFQPDLFLFHGNLRGIYLAVLHCLNINETWMRHTDTSISQLPAGAQLAKQAVIGGNRERRLAAFLYHRKLRKINLAVLRCLDTRITAIGEQLRVGVAHFFIYYRKLRKELQSEKRCDIMRKQKESVTKRGGDNTSKKRYFCSHL